MKKISIGFALGLLTTIAAVSIYVGNLLYTAEPGFRSSDNLKTYSAEEKRNIVSALIKLSELSSLVGLDKYTGLFSGSIAVIGGSEGGINPAEIRAAFFRSMTSTLKYGNTSGDFNPYLESNFTLVLWLKDQGNFEEAKKTLVEATLFALKNAPESYWLQNYKRLEKKL